VRVFGVAAGCTGWTEGRLQTMGKPYRAVTVNDYNHATYFPGALPLTLKLLWEPTTGEILGGQVSGHDGVDKRLDVLATAITAKMTIEDLCHLELAYAPPFGAAKDILNLAGFAATNQMDDLVSTVTELPDDPNVQIVDVRGKPMADASPVPGAINLPMPTLRENLDKLDKNRPVITLCVLGKNSYFASRVLRQHGFEVKSLDGGLKMLINPRTPGKL
jgi:rhodanese-related sulfurtransferase